MFIVRLAAIINGNETCSPDGVDAMTEKHKEQKTSLVHVHKVAY